MVWKCPKCSYTTTSYTAMQRHYYRKHHKPSGKTVVSKGKSKTKFVFKPIKRKR